MMFRLTVAPVTAIRVLLFGLSIFTLFINTPTGTAIAAGDQPQRESPGQRPRQTNPDEKEPQSKDDAIRLGTDLVLLDVTVVDPSNRPVRDLTKDNFLITEDKAAQKIDFFSREQAPVSLVFCLDTSGSMRTKIDTVIKACASLVKESRSGDEVALIEFKLEPNLLEEFTNNTADVVDTLQALIASGQTAMFDALYLAADYANKEGKNRRKAVVLVTDGLDKDSYYKFNEVVEHLREIDARST